MHYIKGNGYTFSLAYGGNIDRPKVFVQYAKQWNARASVNTVEQKGKLSKFRCV